MKVVFLQRQGGPERLVCEAELHFGEDAGVLAGLKLVGFSVWLSPEGEHYVTLPCRPFGQGHGRRYFDLVRSIDGDAEPVNALKRWILARFAEREA